jgi:hypothetical protein
LAISREAAAGRSLAQAIASATPLALAADDPRNEGLVAAHIRNLATKSALTDEDRQFDQTMLLRVLAERLSGSNTFGAFAGDS